MPEVEASSSALVSTVSALQTSPAARLCLLRRGTAVRLRPANCAAAHACRTACDERGMGLHEQLCCNAELSDTGNIFSTVQRTLQSTHDCWLHWLKQKSAYSCLDSWQQKPERSFLGSVSTALNTVFSLRHVPLQLSVSWVQAGTLHFELEAGPVVCCRNGVS